MNKEETQDWLEHAKVSCPTCPYKHNLSSKFIEALLEIMESYAEQKNAEMVIPVAKRLLKRWNDERENEGDWPAGQGWDELAGSSQSTLCRSACELLGLDWNQIRANFRKGKG